MTGTSAPLAGAVRRAWFMGLALCLGTPALVAGLVLSGLAPAGTQRPEGTYLQLGHIFTGLVFLSAAWVLWRKGVILRTLPQVPEALRPGLALRETLVYAALFELSSLYGLVYWLLVGAHAGRHVAGFIVLPPLLFLVLAPRRRHWQAAASGGEAR